MKTHKKLGIWLDHENAHLIDLTSDKNNRTISSNFDFETKEEALSRSEHIMHNKRQQMHEAYYKEVGNEILKYNHILLFGPTNAKNELSNYLNKDLRFKDIIIKIESADKMSDNKLVAFVKNHFEKVS
jgi:stalled ribosome rescue protein Dom34